MGKDNYYGMAIGGPLDGQFVEHWAPTMKVPEIEGPTELTGRLSTTEVTQRTWIYTLRDFYVFQNGKTVHLWLTREMTNDEIFQHFIDGYRRPKLA